MKSIVWLFYVSSIVIMRIQADVTDEEHSAMCSMCEDPAIPSCESTDNTKLDRQNDCSQQGCVIATDSETNYVCILESKSTQSSQLEPEVISEQSLATVLPVPLALQMVTTEGATDASKDIDNPVDIDENGNAEAEDNGQVEEQHTAAEQIEAQQENSDTNDKSSEKEKEPQPIETEHNEDQAVEAGVGEITIVEGNAEATHVTSAEDVAAVQTVEQETVVESDNGPQSPDYPADAPAINEGETNVDVQNPTATAEKPEGTEQTVPQNTNDINAANDENDANTDTLDTNKDVVAVNNYDEQTALNGGGTAVVEHSDDTASTANVGEAAKPAMDNAASQDVETSNAVNTPPNVIVDNISPPVNADQLLSCYSCSSTTDAKCAPGPGRAMNCQPTENKQNGCYTLYKADTNVTTRGCISELTNDGLKYCKSNSKQCMLCYEKVCNNLLAPSAAIQSNTQLSLWLGLTSFMLASFLL